MSFTFKQFTIQQDRCAMKVCTDACLFGAWVAEQLASGKLQPGKILDIGSGTGLLSLMLAQKTPAEIDAVEIDGEAVAQSKENIHAAGQAEKITVYHTNVTDLPITKEYDLIICNPPFYENQLTSPDHERNAAMHSSALTLSALAEAVKRTMDPSGYVALLLPFERQEEWERLLTAQGFFINEIVNIAHSVKHKPFRSFILSSFSKATPLISAINIKTNTTDYSTESIRLLKDYYLAF